jgi:cell division protein FtsQ
VITNNKSVKKQTKIVRGASKATQQQRKPSRVMFYLRKLVLIAVSVGVIYYGNGIVAGWMAKPVDDVLVKGEFLLVSKQEVADRIYSAIEAGFLQLDLEKIRTAIKENPWVDQVTIKKRWPSALSVTVIEHKPIARWGGSDVLSHRGEVIVLDENSNVQELKELPLLYGPSGYEQEVMEQYQLLMKLMAAKGLMITELGCDESLSWNMSIGNIPINIGRDRVVEKLGKFLLVYEIHLKQRWSELGGIDLRYDAGLAVGWNTVEKV